MWLRLYILRKALRYGLAWAGFLALWLLFVSTVTPSELAAGAFAAGIAIFGLNRSICADPLRFAPRLRWLAQAARIPGMILAGLWALVETLARHFQHKHRTAIFQVARFSAPTDSPADAARRALAVFLLTTPPNSIVVDVDTEHDLIMFHQVKKTAPPQALAKLEG